MKGAFRSHDPWHRHIPHDRSRRREGSRLCSSPLPPANPPHVLDRSAEELHAAATAALGQLALAGAMVPSINWFLYGFVRKEAVITSQIEGTQATLADVLTFEATEHAERPEDVEEVCNYVDALTHVRRQLHDAGGLPLSARLLCEAHRVLLRGARGEDSQPGEVRRSQNWVGGTRPGNAHFVPPPPDEVPSALSALEKWIHSADPLPPIVRIGLAHVQFETIHPFLDGNGRIGRLLIALLLEHWDLLDQPLLYISLPLKQRQQEYYTRLSAVRSDGDWEGWTAFFLECVTAAADDGVSVSKRLHALIGNDRLRLLAHERCTVAAIHLFERLPENPVMTVSRGMSLLGMSAPTVRKAIDLLESIGVLEESTGKERDRVYAYREYMRVLTGDG